MAYALQIFAVILLFGYADSSSGNETKEVTNTTRALNVNNPLLFKKDKDSLGSGKINPLWNFIQLEATDLQSRF